MATPGSWTKTSTNGFYTAKLELTQQSQSVANNTSTVKWAITLLSHSGYFSQIRLGYSLVMGGTTISSRTYSNDPTQHNMSKNDSLVVASGTTTIAHNSDGSKSFATGTITFSISSAGIMPGGGQNSISGSNTSAFTLDTIARASTVTSSASSNLMGKTRTITITRSSPSFTHTLKFTFGNASGTIATGVATSYSWTVPTSLAAQVASGSIRASGTIICETYSGSTKVGEATTTFLAQIPPSTATTSASDTTMGKTRSFTISRAASQLTHTLTYVFGSGSGTITTKTTSTSVSWTVPTSLTQYVAANNTSRTGTVTVTTFNGSAEVGTSTVSFTAKIPKSTMTKSNCTMGKSTSFTITRAGTNLTHKITYSFGGTSGTAVATADGTTLSWTPPYSLAGQLAITSGTKSGTITYTLTTYNGTASIGTNTYTATLSAPTASATVPSSFTMGTAKAVSLTEQDAAFAHTLTGTFGGVTKTFVTKSTATSVNVTWATADFASLIPTTKSATGTIKQTVYASSSSSTVVAYNEYTTTVSVPSTAPTATITTSVVTSLASPFNTVYIQNNSQVRVAVALSSPTGAYLDKATMTIDGVTKSYSISSNVTSWSGNVTSNLLQTSGTRTITVKVTDKRGYSGTYTTTISVTAYSNPTISAASGESKVIIERSNSSGTADPAGSYLHLKFIRKISAITNNTGYVSYKVGSGTATTISTSTTGSVTINQTLNLGWSEHNTYQVTVRVWDSVGYETARTVTIPSLNVTLDLRSGGLGVGVGMFSQGTNRFDVAWNSWFQNNIYAKELQSYAGASATGYHTALRICPYYQYEDFGLTSNATYEDKFKAWLRQVCVDFPGAVLGEYIGGYYATGVGEVFGHINDTGDLVDGLPRHSSFMYMQYTGDTDTYRGRIFRFGTYNGEFWLADLLPDKYTEGTLTYVSNAIITSSANLGMRLYKVGKVVTLHTPNTVLSSSTASALTQIATIPAGFRPITGTVSITAPLQTTSGTHFAALYAYATGALSIIKPTTSTAVFRTTLTWITP